MVFENDVYISYAAIDNVPLTEGQEGWVTRFHTALSRMLPMRLGRQVKIWRDYKPAGDDIFADEVIQQFPKTAVFLAVLSPRYLQSEGCLRELRGLCDATEQTGGVMVGNRSRVLKIIKTPVADESPLPDVLRLELGYAFFVFDEQQKVPLALVPADGGESTEKFNRNIHYLAIDIAELITKMELPAAQQSLSTG